MERGVCGNSDINGDNACGSFCCPVSLAPGEEKSFVFTIGNACDEEEIKEQVASASDYPLVHEQLEELQGGVEEEQPLSSSQNPR